MTVRAKQGKPTNKDPKSRKQEIPATLRSKIALFISPRNAYLRLFTEEDVERAREKEYQERLQAVKSAPKFDPSRPEWRRKLNHLKKRAKINVWYHLAFGITAKDNLISILKEGKVTQGFLDKMCEHMKMLRDATHDDDPDLPLYPALQALEEIKPEDLSLDDDYEKGPHSAGVYALGHKLGYIRRDWELNPSEEDHQKLKNAGSGATHREDITDNFCRVNGKTHVYRQGVIQAVDEYVYSDVSSSHVGYYETREAYDILNSESSRMKGVYALYYTVPGSDGNPIYFRSCLRIGYFNQVGGCAVIRCKLNIADITHKYSDPLEHLSGGTRRYQYRGKLNSLKSNLFSGIDLDQVVDSYEGTDEKTRQSMEPDTVRLLMISPNPHRIDTECIITSLSQRPKNEQGVRARRLYSARGILVRQTFERHHNAVERDQAEFHFMQQEPRYFTRIEDLKNYNRETAAMVRRYPHIFGIHQPLEALTQHLPDTDEARKAMNELREYLEMQGLPAITIDIEKGGYL